MIKGIKAILTMRLSQQPRSKSFVSLGIFLLELGAIYFDDFSGPYFSFAVFYILLIYLAAYYVSPRFSLLTATLAGTGRTFIKSQSFPSSAMFVLSAWQLFSSLSVFLLICFLLNREISRANSAQLAPSSAANNPSQTLPSPSFLEANRYLLALFLILVVGIVPAGLWIFHADSSPLFGYEINSQDSAIIAAPLTHKPSSIDDSGASKPLMLSFDDGPQDSIIDHKILAIMKEHKAHSIWFVNCKNFDPQKNPKASENRQTLLDVFHAGHIIGNHGYNHIRLDSLDATSLAHEVRDCNRLIASITGKNPKYFRAPWGTYSPLATSFINGEGMQIVNWAANSNDISKRSLHDAEGTSSFDQWPYLTNSGDIILMHDNEFTATHLKKTLAILESRGFVFVLPN